jgi:predicted dithiol-disulfide oxidoreductase (DUF899 family)
MSSGSRSGRLTISGCSAGAEFPWYSSHGSDFNYDFAS